MAYIGSEPITGNFIYADDITASATNTYNILVGGVAFSPESANHLIVSLNGVIQKANTSFSVSGSQITFLPSSGTLSSSDSIDFILILGRVNDIGVASSVTDSSITKGKLNLISDSSSAGLTVKGDGSSENGTIQLNCSQNSHGIKLSSPAHSSGQSYELIFPTGNVTADKVLKVASVSGSGATGIGQLSFGDAGGANTPSFIAKSASGQSIPNATHTIVVFGTEVIDTDNAFASNRFTVPSGKAGKYFLYAQAGQQGWSSNRFLVYLIKNGGTDLSASEETVSQSYYQTCNTATIADLSEGDYVEVKLYHDDGSAETLSAGDRTTFFGYKLI